MTSYVSGTPSYGRGFKHVDVSNNGHKLNNHNGSNSSNCVRCGAYLYWDASKIYQIIADNTTAKTCEEIRMEEALK